MLSHVQRVRSRRPFAGGAALGLFVGRGSEPHLVPSTGLAMRRARPIPVRSSFLKRASGRFWRRAARAATGRPSKREGYGSMHARP